MASGIRQGVGRRLHLHLGNTPVRVQQTLPVIVGLGCLTILNCFLVSQGLSLILFCLVRRRQLIGISGNLHLPLQIRLIQRSQNLALYHLVPLFYIHGDNLRVNVGNHIYAVGTLHRSADGEFLLDGLLFKSHYAG